MWLLCGRSGEGQADPEAGLRDLGWSDAEPLIRVNTSPRRLVWPLNPRIPSVIISWLEVLWQHGRCIGPLGTGEGRQLNSAVGEGGSSASGGGWMTWMFDGFRLW